MMYDLCINSAADVSMHLISMQRFNADPQAFNVDPHVVTNCHCCNKRFSFHFVYTKDTLLNVFYCFR